MTRLRAIAAVVWLTTAAGAAAIACNGSRAAAGGAGDGGPAQGIVVGVVDSLTGGNSGIGIGMSQAIGVAAQQVNRVGILGGVQITFDVRDDTSDPTVSRTIVQSMLDEGVAGIIGPISSGEVQSVQDLTYAAHVVELTGSATSIFLSADQPTEDRYLFRTAPPDALQGDAITQFLRDGVPLTGADGGDAGTVGGFCQEAFIVNGLDAYGMSLGNAVLSDFPTASARVLGQAEVPTTLQTDYGDAASQVVAAHPQCLVLVVYADVGAAFLRTLQASIAADTGHDWSGFRVCGSDGEYDTNFILDGLSDPANPTSSNSAASCYGTAPDTAPSTPAFATFRDIWRQSYPTTDPPPYAANQYDATLLLALAIAKAGTASDGQAIRDALIDVANPPGTVYGPGEFVDALDALARGEEIDYDGASGDCDFDPSGDVRADYIVWQVVKQQADAGYVFETLGELNANDLH
ncbi:MAG TPA: ABC transporter substrate-binding protein [Polyangiaceae bacterium]|jgi:ABC-type branched-subunit amino acid transport system substrate-binding protein